MRGTTMLEVAAEMEKLKGGWAMDRTPFSTLARNVVEVAIGSRRSRAALPDDALADVRFKDDGAILARLESMFSEEEFMADIGPCIDKALLDAARSDYWYTYEKKYEDNYGDVDVPDETEIDGDE